eukprot:4085190-Alexandrium_andersonii.AAC.1
MRSRVVASALCWQCPAKLRASRQDCVEVGAAVVAAVGVSARVYLSPGSLIVRARALFDAVLM